MFATPDEFWEAGRDARTCAVCRKPLDRPEPGWERADFERLLEIVARLPGFVEYAERQAGVARDREQAPAVQERPLELLTCSHDCASAQRIEIGLKMAFAVRARAGTLQPRA